LTNRVSAAKPRALFLLFALTSSWWFSYPQTASGQQTVGTVSQASGSVQLVRAGVTGGVTRAMAVELHDQITTGAASEVTVLLSDNQSSVALGESTTLVFDENVVGGGVRQRTLVRLLQGGVSSLIHTALFNNASTYEVHTPNAVVSSRGTDFDTTYIQGFIRPGYEGCQRYTDVRVREGVVAVTNPANPGAQVDVPAGYETTVPCLLPPLNAGPLGITGAAAPGTAASGNEGGEFAAIGLAGAVSGFSAPPPGLGGPPPAAPPPVAPGLPIFPPRP
jgi:hypothetical protein